MKKLVLLAGFLMASSAAFAITVPGTAINCTSGQGTQKYQWCHLGIAPANDNKLECIALTAIAQNHGDGTGLGHTLDHFATPAELTAGRCGVNGVPTPTGDGFSTGHCVGDQCGKLTNKTAQFNFNVQSGGIKDMLYVCEVGFRPSLCGDGSCVSGQDYMILDFPGAIADLKVYQSAGGLGVVAWSGMDPALAPTSASLFLNSTNFGEGWYVKYCYDVVRSIVGDIANVGAYSLEFDADLQVLNGSDNGYYAQSGLQYKWTFNCGDFAEPDENPDTYNWEFLAPGTTNPVTAGTNDIDQTIGNKICLSGDCVKKTCSWTANFQETEKCVRTIKNCTPGQVGCSAADVNYAANFSTVVTTKNAHVVCNSTDCDL